MKYILHTDGTWGDLLPFIYLAEELNKHGHQTIIFTNEYYKDFIESRNINFVETTNIEDRNELLSNPDLWKSFSSIKIVAKAANKIFFKSYPKIKSHIEESDIVIGYSFTYAAKTLAEQFNKPYVSLNISPIQIRSGYRTPTFSYNINTDILPKWFKKYLFYQVGNFFLDKAFKKEINNFRKKIELNKITDFIHWSSKADLAIGLWSEEHYQTQIDQEYLKTTNFPKNVEIIKSENQELEDWVNADIKNKPILVTMGSGYLFSKDLFKIIEEIAVESNLRFIFIDSKIKNYAFNNYISLQNKICLSEFLPICKGIIYHGGAGTLAQSIYAGIPQIILPMSHDQPDNGKIIGNHNLGKVLWSKPNVENLNKIIRETFENNQITEKAKLYRDLHLNKIPGIKLAAREIINFSKNIK